MGHFVIHFFFLSVDPIELPLTHSPHHYFGNTDVIFLFILLKYKFWTFKSATVNVPVGNITVKKI